MEWQRTGAVRCQQCQLAGPAAAAENGGGGGGGTAWNSFYGADSQPPAAFYSLGRSCSRGKHEFCGYHKGKQQSPAAAIENRTSRHPRPPNTLLVVPPPPPTALLLLQALVDFPGQIRRVISFKRLALTDFTVEMPRLAKKSVLKKALEDAGACVGRVLCVGDSEWQWCSTREQHGGSVGRPVQREIAAAVEPQHGVAIGRSRGEAAGAGGVMQLERGGPPAAF